MSRSKQARKEGKLLARSAHRVKVLAKREGGLCALCGQPVDPQAVGEWAASVDHIIPLSFGGKRGMDNCQLAHTWCNHRRGNRLLGSDELE